MRTRTEVLQNLGTIHRIVIKIGSNLIIHPETKEIQNQIIDNLIQDILFLRKRNIEVILVSSGAIAFARKLLSMQNGSHYSSLIKKQALASIGQIELMNFYKEKFSQYNLGIAQILITANDFRDRVTYLNIGHTVQEILKMNQIPIINENDTVSTDEIKFGDNDFLSGATASLLHAQLLFLLTSVEGFIVNEKRVSLLNNINEQTLKYAKGPTGFGSGGMYSKIRVGKLCLQSGLSMAILPGFEKNSIQRFFLGEDIGTLIYPEKRFYIKAKKRWLLFAKTKGAIIIDEGAEIALKQHCKSLLLVGIKDIEGSFTYGDVVEIKNQKHQVIGRGVIYIPSRILKNKIANIKERTSYLENFPYEVVHRNNLILESI